jgi:phosphonoacetaldehyde hydrolase
MMNTERRTQKSTIAAVIFDWAGTLVDYGCFAPTMVFVEGFRRFGVDITLAEARAPMGLHKRDHIAAVLAGERVAAAWAAVHGAPPSDADVQRIFDDFAPRQIAVIARYATPIPGIVEMLAALRARGIKIGSCTGYTRPMIDALLPAATAHGVVVDASVTPDEVPAGRPAPFMIYQNALALAAAPLWTMIKVGDTPSDMEEGRNAGMWTVGVAATGNELGMTAEEAVALPTADLRARLAPIYERLYAAGAHVVIDSAAELMGVVDVIEARMAAGEKP